MFDNKVNCILGLCFLILLAKAELMISLLHLCLSKTSFSIRASGFSHKLLREDKHIKTLLFSHFVFDDKNIGAALYNQPATLSFY